ncbi:hypothetical protein L3Q82_012954, partial [Scortum barcoo]
RKFQEEADYVNAAVCTVEKKEVTSVTSAISENNTKLTEENQQLKTLMQHLNNQTDTTLTAENQNLETQIQELETERDTLTQQITDMETERNELNVSRAQWSIDAYCPKDNNVRECKPCLNDWNIFQSSCFSFHDPSAPEWKTWEEAREDCRGKGSDLAVIVNEAEKNFLIKNGSWTDGGFWIGLRAEGGKWKWFVGSDLTETEVFNSHLRKSFSQIPREAGDIESIVDAAVQSVVDTRSLVPVVAVTSLEPMVWWTPKYRQAKQAAAWTVLEAKTRVWEEFGEAMEEDYHLRSASKRFWQTVRRLKRGKQYSANTVYSAGGELLTSTGDFVGRWKKYFKDLKSLDVVGLSWLTRLLQHCMEVGDSASGVANRASPGRSHARVLERRIRPIVDPRIQEEQCGFRPGCGTLDQLYTLRRVLEGLWEFAQPVHMCFVDLEKAFDRVPRGILWGVLHEYGVQGPLLRAVRSLY